MKIPPEAFAFYLALGPGRSYQAVADHYGVTKQGVQACADREGWPAKLAAAETKVADRAETKAVESLAVMHERHLAQIRAVQIVAVQTLQQFPTMANAMEAARAIQMMITMERLVRGEATERTEATTLGELAREAYEEQQAAKRSAAAAEREEQEQADREQEQPDEGGPVPGVGA